MSDEFREIVPDKSKAKGFVLRAEKDMKIILEMSKINGSTNLIIRDIYECFRMLGEALLILRGIKSEGHVLPINELIKFSETEGHNLRMLDSLRRLRHNINYYAYSATQSEGEEVLRIANKYFNILADKILEKIKES